MQLGWPFLNCLTTHSLSVSCLLQSAKLNDLEKVFELPVSKHLEIKKTRADNKLLKGVWDMISVVRHVFNDW
jgi:hypothetical protein